MSNPSLICFFWNFFLGKFYKFLKVFLYNDVLVGVLPSKQRWGHGGEGGLAALHGHQPHRKNKFYREDYVYFTLVILFTHVIL
jgi:hypothetical protein